MITKKINLPKCPTITVYYCATIDEAYAKINYEHKLDVNDILFESDDTIHGFTITDELEDSIQTAVHEGMQAALNIVRRKFFYTFDDSKQITIGDDIHIDDFIFEIVASVVGKVLIANEKD